MNLSISLEARFLKTPDQKIWSETGLDYVFWARYLNVFDSLRVIARVQNIACVSSNYRRSDGDRVKFISFPYYIGPFQYICKAIKCNKIASSVVKDAEAVLLRTPGQVSSSVFYCLRKNRHPYGVELVGDPHDVFAPGSIDHPLRRFFRWWMTKQVKAQCKDAIAVAYVTKETLQKRYPNAFHSTHYSSIAIQKEAYVSSPKDEYCKDNVFSLVFIGSLAQLYKSPDILIDAVALCRTNGYKVRLKILGDGKFRKQLEEQVARLGCADLITFLGQVPAGDAVRNELKQADIFILPSRTEGLPRAMIEAMACGLPCIGTTVGGIPELLPDEDLVPPGNVQALADKIIEVISNPVRMRNMATRNLKNSMDFRNEILAQRRREFYSHLRQETDSWIKENKKA